MRVQALGQVAIRLTWLSPCAASMAALARSAADAWSAVRDDPGVALLLLRQSPDSPPSLFPTSLHEPALLERAVDLIGHAPPPPDWNLPALRPVRHASVAFARLAGHLAERLGRCDPSAAWVAGLIAPLGWLAAAAVEPGAAARCLEDAAHADQPAATQRKHWGLDQASIGRRLARRWRLPGWAAAVVGALELPADLAVPLGAEPALFQTVQLAVSLAQRHGVRLGLAVGASPAELLEALGRPAAELAVLDEEAVEVVREPLPEGPCKSPRDEPLLRDLLTLAADNRRLRDCGSLGDVEEHLDELHRLLAEQRRGEEDRLRQHKLTALAEFAAGAGHEINNPLAVISGQAQYLLGHEPDAGRQKSLQAIIQQAQRIHQALRDLMQFARPPRPRPHLFDLGELVREIVAALTADAEQRRVRLDCQTVLCTVLADRGQVASSVLCLVRNAIEAAPEGWAVVKVKTAGDRAEVVVEDGGDGLKHLGAAQREHIFDPFFSGRQAGRGRGLGLPTAWRLARENGGDVRWDAEAVGLTRFVLSLPRAAEVPPLPVSEPIPA